MTTRKKVGMGLLAMGVVVGGWLGVAYLVQERWRRITVGRETTFVTGPLRADGTVDYVGAMNERCSARVTPETNAAVLLLRATGPNGYLIGDMQDLWLKRLGVEKPPEKGDYFVGFEDLMKARVGKAKNWEAEQKRNEEWGNREDMRKGEVWREGDDADMAAWLKQNEIPLKGVVEASRCERFYSPLTGKNVMQADLGPLGIYRGMASALMTRAMMRLGGGDVAGYRDDVIAAARLGLLVMQGPTVIQRIVGRSMVERAYRGVEVGLGGRMSVDEAKIFLDSLRGLTAMPEMVEAMDLAERAMVLDIITDIARFGRGADGPPDEVTGERRREWLGLRVIPVKFDDVMRECNTLWDAQVNAARKTTYAERNTALREVGRMQQAIAERAETRLDPVRKALDMLLCLCFNHDFVKLYAYDDATRMRGRLAELGLLLEIYRGAHGAYPEALAALAKEEVRGADQDFFSGGKMVYRRDGPGYVVYSVGINARDDGGHERPKITTPVHVWNPLAREPEADLPDDLVLRVSPLNKGD